MKRSSRVLVRTEISNNGESRINYSAKSTLGVIQDYETIIGYIEPVKGFPISSSSSFERFVSYIEDGAGVEFFRWFDGRLTDEEKQLIQNDG